MKRFARRQPLQAAMIGLAILALAASAPSQTTQPVQSPAQPPAAGNGRWVWQPAEQADPTTATAPATQPGGIFPPGYPRRSRFTPGVRPDPATLTDDQILAATRKGIDYLLGTIKEESKRANENETRLRVAYGNAAGADRLGEYQRAQLMLAAYALLYAGREIEDPRLRFNSEELAPLVKIALETNTTYNYGAAMQACALAQLPDRPEFRKKLASISNSLVAGMGQKGGYTYYLSSKNTNNNYYAFGGWDNSNTQYGLLGVWAAAEAGIEVPTSYWTTTDQFWRRVQCKTGGWDYVNGTSQQRPSLTVAGLASLLVCDSYTNIVPRSAPTVDKNIDRSLAAMIDEFDPKSSDLYYLYGVERVGLASGIKFLKTTNWFRECAATVISLQQPDGSFAGSFMGSSPTVSTSYAVLFLLRGRAPVVMNKLQYGGEWNNRHRDAANLARWFSRQFERHISWQIVNTDAAAEDWQDAPILYITGGHDPLFTKDDLAKLRQFVEAGGIVLSTAESGSSPFTEAVRKYAGKIVDNRYEMRTLPKEHPLFNIYIKYPNPPKVMALGNGVREFWIHVPADYGAAWQSRRISEKEPWEISANLYFYTTGKGSPRAKLQPLTVPPATQPAAQHAAVARLKYAGNWDPEPGAWPRFAKIMASRCQTDLDIQTLAIADLAAAPNPPRIAHLLGTTRWAIKDEEIAALRTYVENGGTLFIEAAGGNPAFITAADELAKRIAPAAEAESLPLESPLYKGDFPGGTRIEKVDYRKCWILANGAREQPNLRAYTVNNRPAIIIADDDITSGLLGTNTWGVNGYAAESSVALARNLVMYANAKAPATAPAK